MFARLGLIRQVNIWKIIHIIQKKIKREKKGNIGWNSPPPSIQYGRRKN